MSATVDAVDAGVQGQVDGGRLGGVQHGHRPGGGHRVARPGAPGRPRAGGPAGRDAAGRRGGACAYPARAMPRLPVPRPQQAVPAGRPAAAGVQPAPGRGQRRAGAGGGPVRPRHVRDHGRAADVPAGARLRLLRGRGPCPGPTVRGAPGHPAGAAVARPRSLRPGGGVPAPGRSSACRCWPWRGWRWPTCCSPRWSSCTSRTGSAG